MRCGRRLPVIRGPWGLPQAVGGAILVLTVGLALGREALTQPAPSIIKSPQQSSLFLGGPSLTINEEVANVPPGPGLGAFSFRFFYNSSLINVTVQEGPFPFLGSTGRQTTCLTQQGEGFVQFSCVSSSTTPGLPGPTGSGTLATITVRPKDGLVFRPTVNNGAVATLDDVESDARLANILGSPIDVGNVGTPPSLSAPLRETLTWTVRSTSLTSR